MKFIKSMMIIALLFFQLPACSEISKKERVSSSLVKILVDPEPLFGYEVITHGYLSEYGGHLRLFLTKEDALMGNDDSSVRLLSESVLFNPKELKRCINRYAKIFGVLGPRRNQVVYKEVNEIFTYDLNVSEPLSESCWRD